MKTLPEPENDGKISVEQAIAERRSIRSFSNRTLSDRELSQLLWAAQGITDESRKLRASPSAGATYPLNTYVFSESGIFRYIPDGHKLEMLDKKDRRASLSRAALGQNCVLKAPISIVFTAVPERTTARYGKRGTMYIHMEAGHAAQNIHLQAVALGLGSVPVGAFNDDEVSSLLDLTGTETPLYIISAGEPAMFKGR